MAFNYMLKKSLEIVLILCIYNIIGLKTIEANETNEANHIERNTKFESLLAGGRTLAFPFATGLLLTLVTNHQTNWHISQTGLEKVLGLSPTTLLTTYSRLVQELQQDENVTLTSTIYALHLYEGWNSSTQVLNQLETNITTILWDEENANKTWEIMNNNVAESTNNKLDGKLIPRNSVIGTPFPFSTESTIVSTFHYENDWENKWSDVGLKRFYDSGKVTFLQGKGEYLVSVEEDFTAVKIPLEGQSKSFVLVLPNINITKYFRHVTARDGLNVDGEDEDLIPFPKKWQKKRMSILVPAFNHTTLDQYGRDLEELGMNETFCTTLFDRKGKIPYYLRPIVQVNTIEFTEEYLELASATGTAVEKFYLGLDLGGKGYPKLKYKSLNESQPDDPVPTATPTPNDSLELETEKEQAEANTTTITFDRPFLWYLHDEKVGPMFYGVVQKIEQQDSEEDEQLSQQKLDKDEVEKFIMWSCRSFKQSGEVDENTKIDH